MEEDLESNFLFAMENSSSSEKSAPYFFSIKTNAVENPWREAAREEPNPAIKRPRT